jgi:hypothetical protein
MMKQNHLTADRIMALKNGSLSGLEAAETLGHIGECGQCAEAFAECFAEDELMELPVGFAASVLSVVEKEKRITVERSRFGLKRELFGYSFRVGIAACITLFLLFSGTIDYGLGLSRSIHTDLTGVQTITENLRDLSNRLVDFGITKYKKEV